jgi:hypothetical protein
VAPGPEPEGAEEVTCSNPRCKKELLEDRFWLGYCDDACAYGHKELEDDGEAK